MTVQPGSISTATLRTQDLIVAFLDTVPFDVHNRLVSEYPDVVIWAEQESAHVWAESDEPEDAQWLLEELVDALDAIAPDGYYFGAHPGDGADFGYWPIEDEDSDES